MIINVNVKNKSGKRGKVEGKTAILDIMAKQGVGRKITHEPNLKEGGNDPCGYLQRIASGKVLQWKCAWHSRGVPWNRVIKGEKSKMYGRKMRGVKWGNEDHKGFSGPILGLDFNNDR